MSWVLLTILLSLVLLLGFLILKQNLRIKELEKMLGSERVKRGKVVEQLLPLSPEYPYNPRRFRFIGDPIDGIQFEDDKIVLIEFKSGKSSLSSTQKRIKELVEKGKVEFRLFKVRE